MECIFGRIDPFSSHIFGMEVAVTDKTKAWDLCYFCYWYLVGCDSDGSKREDSNRLCLVPQLQQ